MIPQFGIQKVVLEELIPPKKVMIKVMDTPKHYCQKINILTSRRNRHIYSSWQMGKWAVTILHKHSQERFWGSANLEDGKLGKV